MTAAARSPLAGGPGAARLRAIALVLLLLPPLTLLPGLLDGDFDARPWEALNAASGEWALWVLLATLAITPLRRVGHWPRLLLVRRRVGVGCFCYLAFHLLAFVADKGFALGLVAGEIAQRTYLIVGFAAFVVLATLAATSTDAMLRRLGGRRWRRLHKLVYAAAILGVLHVFLQSKLELARPSLFAGLALWRRPATGRVRARRPAAAAT